ncbi:MAG TPA: M42 family metallopeptidase [Anaerolineales bacterium]|nr:M42 family metallopeptidase [Anaerolineales bacterium]
MDPTEQLLKELTEAHGISGYEAPVRAIVRERLKPLGELSQDKSGSVICLKPGAETKPRVMLAGHMDEIGFMVKHVTKDGFIKFLQLGGWFDQVLLGQRVIVKTRANGDVVGVIGARPPHLIPMDERSKVVEKKDMYIDVGASSREEVEKIGVRAGDPVVPRADFVKLANEKTYLSKAFDDRVGTALIISTLEALQDKDHPNAVYGAVTVQEEVGLRGARTSAWVVEPDVAIILESDIAGDVPGIEADVSDVKLGKGPTVLLYDGSMIPNGKLRDFVIDAAEAADIPLQLSYVQAGGTDGGAIHQHKTGVPTVVIGVAARHIHSHGAIIHRDDFDNAVKLLTAVITKLDAAAVAGFTS